VTVKDNKNTIEMMIGNFVITHDEIVLTFILTTILTMKKALHRKTAVILLFNENQIP